MKAPAFQFYPGDWMKDPALRAVSLTARGLWIDLLCLMWESPTRGRLLHGAGGPITLDQLGRMCGCAGKQAERLVAELEGCGVCSRGQDGALESRRMMRDEALRKVRAEGGLLGGNPALKVIPKVRDKVGDKVNLPANHAPTFGLTPSSSSSSSSSDKVNLPPTPSLLDDAARTFQEFRLEAKQAGMDGSEVDWDEGLIEWRRLDIGQRLEAIQGIRARIGEKDSPELNALPKNYLAKQMWQRRVRQKVQSKREVLWDQV